MAPRNLDSALAAYRKSVTRRSAQSYEKRAETRQPKTPSQTTSANLAGNDVLAHTRETELLNCVSGGRSQRLPPRPNRHAVKIVEEHISEPLMFDGVK